MAGEISVLVVDDAADAGERWRALLDATGIPCTLKLRAAASGLDRAIATGCYDVVVAHEEAAEQLLGSSADRPPLILITGDRPVGRHDPDSVHRIARCALQPNTFAPLLRAATAHAAAAAALREAEERLRSHFESLPNPASVWRAVSGGDFVLIDVNDAAEALTRGRMRARLGERASSFFAHRPDIIAIMRRCVSERAALRREGPYVLSTTGEQRYLASTYAFVPPDVVVAHTEDRTDRWQAESEIVERERRFRALFDSARDAILVADDTGRFVDGNPAALTLLGVNRQQLLSLYLRDIAVNDTSADDATWRDFLRNGAQAGRVIVRRGDGALRTVDFSATTNFTPGRHLSILRDVTEREELERELQHVQRLDSIGRLAGGIAHDFNNLLTAILGFADLLLLTLRRNDPRRTDLGEIHRAAQSAAGLTRQLLAFSRKQVLKPVVLDLNKHIAGLTALLRRLLGDAIVVRTRFHPRQLRITADPTQLEQIVLNLAINARDAMPGGGTLEMITERVVITAGTIREGSTVKPGKYARLVVTDTGHGMSAETMSHIFEPFFTTKLRSNGTGLGLPTVYGIVTQSGGYIWVSSQEGVGTSFELLLPAATRGAAPQPRRRAPRKPKLPCTVLIVDDDRAIRALAARTLTREGFTVVVAANAIEALDVIKTTADLGLLLTDIVMPDMSGVELAATVRTTRPGLRVLFMSGFADEAAAPPEQLPAAGDVLLKPFTPDLLLQSVLHALEGGDVAPVDAVRSKSAER